MIFMKKAALTFFFKYPKLYRLSRCVGLVLMRNFVRNTDRKNS